MARIEIDEYGCKSYYNDRGEYHREDGPAIIFPFGTKFWYTCDIQHSIEHPVDVVHNGDITWMFEGNYHRENGPADESPNGFKGWYRMGHQIWPEL